MPNVNVNPAIKVDLGLDAPNADILRVSYVTPDEFPLAQTLQFSNTPETLIFNSVDVPSSRITVDPATGVFTFVQAEYTMFSLLVQLVREVGGTAGVDWMVFVETSVDGGVTWMPLAASTRRVSFTKAEVNEFRQASLIAPIRATQGTKFRFRHSVTDASRNVSVISQPSDGIAPSGAGILVGFFSVRQ